MTKSKDGMYWVSGWQHGAWKYDPSSIRNLTVNDSIPASGKNKMIVEIRSDPVGCHCWQRNTRN